MKGKRKPAARKRAARAIAPLPPWVEAAAASWREAGKKPPAELVGPFRDGAAREEAGRLWQAVERALIAADVQFDLDTEGQGEWADQWAGYVIDWANAAHEVMRAPLRSAARKRTDATRLAATLRKAAAALAYPNGWHVDPESIAPVLREAIEHGLAATLERHAGDRRSRRREELQAVTPAGWASLLNSFALETPTLLRRAADAAERWAKELPMAPQPDRPGARRGFLVRYLWDQIEGVGGEPHVLSPIAVELAWRLALLLAPCEGTELALRDAERMIDKWKKSRAID